LPRPVAIDTRQPREGAVKKGLHRPRLNAIIPILTAVGSHPDCRAVLIQIVALYLGVDATTHGFRISFRDWCGDCTKFPRETAEAALAHLVGDAVERAYRRGDAFEQRRQLMQAWANSEPKAGKVNALRRGCAG
jgi:hypothetical protein